MNIILRIIASIFVSFLLVAFVSWDIDIIHYCPLQRLAMLLVAFAAYAFSSDKPQDLF
jgi:hypothetical protein